MRCRSEWHAPAPPTRTRTSPVPGPEPAVPAARRRCFHSTSLRACIVGTSAFIVTAVRVQICGPSRLASRVASSSILGREAVVRTGQEVLCPCASGRARTLAPSARWTFRPCHSSQSAAMIDVMRDDEMRVDRNRRPRFWRLDRGRLRRSAFDVSARGLVGRVALVVEGLIVVVPVNYHLVVEGGKTWIVFRTKRRRCPPPERARGLRGRRRPCSGAHRLVGPRSVRLAARRFRRGRLPGTIDPSPWTRDERDRWMVLEPFSITGRRITSAW